MSVFTRWLLSLFETYRLNTGILNIETYWLNTSELRATVDQLAKHSCIKTLTQTDGPDSTASVQHFCSRWRGRRSQLDPRNAIAIALTAERAARHGPHAGHKIFRCWAPISWSAWLREKMEGTEPEFSAGHAALWGMQFVKRRVAPYETRKKHAFNTFWQSTEQNPLRTPNYH